MSTQPVTNSFFDNQDKQCMICRAEIRNVAVLTCGHPFDDSCIRVAWADREVGPCPLCKRDVSILPTDPKQIIRLLDGLQNRESLQNSCNPEATDHPHLLRTDGRAYMSAEEFLRRIDVSSDKNFLSNVTNNAFYAAVGAVTALSMQYFLRPYFS